MEGASGARVKVGEETSVTVTLRKAGPRDYRIPKSYRPAALLNTLGKVLEAIVATRIAWLVEEYNLLPKTHLGGRKGISVDHAIQLILGRVHQAWGDSKVISILLLDVAGAYNIVSHRRLLFNMRQLGLGGLVPEAFPAPTGIPQGSPISPILFLLFNKPLVSVCHRILPYGESEGFGWVDDVCILATSDSYEENTWILEKALQKAGRWARRHAAKFAPDKFELIHFKNPRAEKGPSLNTATYDPADIWEIPPAPEGHDGMPVIISGTAETPIPTILAPTVAAKYLGVWLDKSLDFTTHRKKMLAKASGSLEALRGISGSTWGSSLIAMRKVYQGVIVPQMLWGLSACFCPAARSMPRGELDKLTRELIKIQRRATILISGAFRGTAGAALDVEMYITPIKLRLHQMAEESAIRIPTGPQWACPQIAKAPPRNAAQRKLGGWSPTEAIARKKPGCLRRGERWEEKRAFVLAPWQAPLPCYVENRQTALDTHDSLQARRILQQDIYLEFTDGSGADGYIGVSTANIHEASSERRYLGTDSQSTVYAAELSGIEMALAKARRRSEQEGAEQAQEVVIFSDSQAAIQAVKNPQRPSGQYVLSVLYEHVRAIRSRNQSQNRQTELNIRWIPAHSDVAGNEYADREAKGAAGLGAKLPAEGDPDNLITRLAAAAKRGVRERTREKWIRQWERERTSAPTKRLVQAPGKKTLRLYEGLSKPQCAILIQMRTMRIGLRYFLYKIKASDTDRCDCEQGSQTPTLFLESSYGTSRWSSQFHDFR
ncbi:hypothetical protein PENVUL_c163G00911 [Penicillium vulpinum]|uniref:RNase H type-1 domain-containing protein n=1 Tax=Penicillium vulpinum TaxID=29845 RepID=A0A1V6QXS0_9EURO|nr:hypothetical protein PENVUL_c163G00911 [Penicillium vulpinum]